MKILDAWVYDPTLSGQVEPPILCVSIDELPDVTIPLEDFPGGWTVGKYGPFVSYSKYEYGTEPHDVKMLDVTAPDFNARFSGRFSPVVDVLLVCEENEIVGYSLPLRRARQLIKKYDSNWHFEVDDHTATQGKLYWRPIAKFPGCRKWMVSETCGRHPARMIRVDSVDMPYCDTHVQQHNKAQAVKRAASKSS